MTNNFLYILAVRLKTTPNSRPKIWTNSILFSDPNREAHTYMAFTRGYPLGLAPLFRQHTVELSSRIKMFQVLALLEACGCFSKKILLCKVYYMFELFIIEVLKTMVKTVLYTTSLTWTVCLPRKLCVSRLATTTSGHCMASKLAKYKWLNISWQWVGSFHEPNANQSQPQATQKCQKINIRAWLEVGSILLGLWLMVDLGLCLALESRPKP